MKKPSAEKIKRETMIMDADQSGTIDRLEWMAYQKLEPLFLITQLVRNRQ